MNRLTILDTIYYESANEQPVRLQSRKSVEVSGKDSPLVRRLTVGADWQILDLAWIERPALVVIENLDEKVVLQIRLGAGEGPAWLLGPGLTFKGCPGQSPIYLRSGGEGRPLTARLHAVPE